MAVWESLLLTALGGGIGTAGTWLGSRMQATQAERVQREQHEREDRFRLHKERIEAYSAFYIAAGHVRQILAEDRTLADRRGARSEMWQAFTTVLLVGHRDVLDAASDLLGYTDSVISNQQDFEQDHYSWLIHRLQHAARTDLTGASDLMPPPEQHPDHQTPARQSKRD
ncbi:hypothetical protein ACFT9M_28880 [Micromonospora purpureochromogenes]|uniref:hypothetical protein n=1 Tax=Micromonospora purpureochromogenes TaxID=47872 RepID=UPI00362E4D39